MEHVAILSKKEKFLNKILKGTKTIESRWYSNKKTPYKNISRGDIIYFKETGEPINVRCVVKKVLFVDILNEDNITEILNRFGNQIGIGKSYIVNLKNKRYCTLVFIKDVEKIKSFGINKAGFGNMAAWITLDNIERIKVAGM